jgi:hypothetical protein
MIVTTVVAVFTGSYLAGRCAPVLGWLHGVIFGLWEIVTAGGSLRQLQGTGVIRVERPSADERLWVLEGEVGRAATASKQEERARAHQQRETSFGD